MLTCPYCGSETSSEYNLCENCEQQVKCANVACGALLHPHKSKCLMCGTPTLEARQVDPSMNRYVRTVNSTSKTYTEHTEVIASDTAIGNFVPLLLNNAQVQPKPQHRSPSPMLRVNPQPQAQLSLPSLAEPSTDIEIGHNDEVAAPIAEELHHSPPSKQDENHAMALEFFEASGDELTPSVVDFKGATRKDQLIRFLITYVWAYQHIFGKPVPSDEHLVAATKRTGLLDGNYRNYFNPTSKLLFLAVDGGFKVNPAGNVEAKRIFEEMKTKSEEGAAYWKGKSKTGNKGPRFSSDDQESIKKWLPMAVNIGAIDVRALEPTQQAMLALWLLTKDLKVAQAIKPRVAFGYLSEKFTTVKGKSEAFTTALSRSSNRQRFGRNADGLYYLLDQGEKEVRAWLNTGAPVTEEASIEEASIDEGVTE